MTVEELKDLGIEITKEISNKIIEISKERSLGDEINSTGSSGDSTKFADEFSEIVIKEILGRYLATNPNNRIVLISEETGLVEMGNPDSESGFFIVLDPLDGSNNIRAWRTPAPSVALGVALGRLETLKTKDNFDAIEVGISMDIFNGRIFYSTRNKPSSVLNFGQISTSPVNELKDSLIGISFDYTQEKYKDVYERVEKIMVEKKCQRRLGSSILDFSKVACGEYDAFISLGGKMGFYDLAAVKLIIENAGGKFEVLTGTTDFCLIKKIIETKDSSLLGKYKYEVLASANDALHKKIIDLM